MQVDFKKKVNKLPPLSLVSDWDTLKHMLGVIMVSQYSLKKEIILFGDKSEKATSAELENALNGYVQTYGCYKTFKKQKQ